MIGRHRGRRVVRLARLMKREAKRAVRRGKRFKAYA